jgi:hypothetical protein
MSTTFLDQFVDPVAEVLTPEAAKRIAELRASPELQADLDDLAEKANRGTLTEDEKAKYDRYLAAFHFISILQARARKILRDA